MDIPAITQNEKVFYEVTTVNDKNTSLASGLLSPGDNFTVSTFSNKTNKNIPFPAQLNVLLYQTNDNGYGHNSRILQSVIIPSMCNKSNPIILPIQIGSIEFLELFDLENQPINYDGRDKCIAKNYGDSKGIRTFSFPTTITSNQQLNLTLLYVLHYYNFYDVELQMISENILQKKGHNGGSRWMYEFGPEQMSL